MPEASRATHSTQTEARTESEPVASETGSVVRSGPGGQGAAGVAPGNVPPEQAGDDLRKNRVERLESAVSELLERQRALRDQNGRLRSALVEREEQLRAVEDRVLESNQRRQDAIKRIDDLISHVDHLDRALEASLPVEGSRR